MQPLCGFLRLPYIKIPLVPCSNQWRCQQALQHLLRQDHYPGPSSAYPFWAAAWRATVAAVVDWQVPPLAGHGSFDSSPFESFRYPCTDHGQLQSNWKEDFFECVQISFAPKGSKQNGRCFAFWQICFRLRPLCEVVSCKSCVWKVENSGNLTGPSIGKSWFFWLVQFEIFRCDCTNHFEKADFFECVQISFAPKGIQQNWRCIAFWQICFRLRPLCEVVSCKRWFWEAVHPIAYVGAVARHSAVPDFMENQKTILEVANCLYKTDLVWKSSCSRATATQHQLDTRSRLKVFGLHSKTKSLKEGRTCSPFQHTCFFLTPLLEGVGHCKTLKLWSVP